MTTKKTAKRKAATKESDKQPTTVLVLKSVKANLTAYKGFQWKESGIVTAPDWQSAAQCGNGLHGWLWGVGDFSLKCTDHDAKWLVLEVEEESIINLNGKVKFPKAKVLKVGTFFECFGMVRQEAIKQGIDTLEASASGHSGHASASGNYGHASASGDYGHASASGYSGHASASGHSGHASAAGYYGHASAAGYSGHASAAGYSGHASASGKYGTACVLGNNGKTKAGKNGSIILTYWDGKRNRHLIGYVGEDGIEADQWYQVKDGKIVKVED